MVRANSRQEIIRKYLIRLARTGRPGDKMPSEKQLCEMFNVARGTVRAAMKYLIDSGWVVPRKSCGVYIQDNFQNNPSRMLFGIVFGSGRSAFYSYYSGMIMSGMIRRICEKRCSFTIIDNILDSGNWSEQIARSNLNGVLWVNPYLEDLRLLLKSGTPMVTIGAIIEPEESDWNIETRPSDVSGVFIDTYQEGCLFAAECLAKKFEKLLVIDARRWRENDTGPFFRGIETVLNERGLDIRKQVEHLRPEEVTDEWLRQALRKGHVGVYCTDAKFNQLSMIMENEGFVHGRNAQVMARPLTTPVAGNQFKYDMIDVKHIQIGVSAVDLLLKRIANPNSEPEHIGIGPVVVPSEEQ